MCSRLLPIFIGALILPLLNLAGQDTIRLNNPSFEDMPGKGDPPRGWFDCQAKDFPNETLCDVHPGIYNSHFDVSTRANHGYTYVGMVVRDNDSWESIAQKLSTPMMADKCYDFSVDLCRSSVYNSGKSEKDPQEYPFIEPVILRIWGGYNYCEKAELLDQTKRVANTAWETYQLNFAPTGNYTHIILEAFYNTPVLFAYDGNILVDNARPIVMKPCPGEEIVVSVDIGEEKVDLPEKESNGASKLHEKPGPQNMKEKKILKELDITVLKEGQKVRIENLFFTVDESKIEEASFPVLEEIFIFLKQNRNVKVEIGGHTNLTCSDTYCDKLSKARAKAVCEYLLSKGVEPERLSYRGYGKRFPLNEETGEESKKRNQRVEIKILSLQG